MPLPVVREAHALLRRFPAMRFAVGYGSGVFRQPGHKSNKNTMVDLVFAVDNAAAWHADNLKWHPDHYSALRFLGPSTIAAVQQNYGARVYFNALVRVDGILIKYGVITVADLVDDLRRWSSFYLAGRLQKPVAVLVDDPEIEAAQEENVVAAARAALLLAGAEITERDVYRTIAGLSYNGDPRMAVSEDPGKVDQIVEGSFDGFRAMYRPRLKAMGLDFDDATNSREPRANPAVGHKRAWLDSLPCVVRDRTIMALESKTDDSDVEMALRAALAATVRSASAGQSVKGIFTAGVRRSLTYGWEKVQKKLTANAKNTQLL